MLPQAESLCPARGHVDDLAQQKSASTPGPGWQGMRVNGGAGSPAFLGHSNPLAQASDHLIGAQGLGKQIALAGRAGHFA